MCRENREHVSGMAAFNISDNDSHTGLSLEVSPTNHTDFLGERKLL